MNRALSILFGLFAIGAVKEALRVTTAPVSDVPHRGELIIITYPLAILFVALTIRYWRKASYKKPGL